MIEYHISNGKGDREIIFGGWDAEAVWDRYPEYNKNEWTIIASYFID